MQRKGHTSWAHKPPSASFSVSGNGRLTRASGLCLQLRLHLTLCLCTCEALSLRSWSMGLKWEASGPHWAGWPRSWVSLSACAQGLCCSRLGGRKGICNKDMHSGTIYSQESWKPPSSPPPPQDRLAGCRGGDGSHVAREGQAWGHARRLCHCSNGKWQAGH